MGLFDSINRLCRRVRRIRNVTLFHYDGLIETTKPLSKTNIVQLVAEAERAGRTRLVEIHGLEILGRLRNFSFPWSRTSS